MIGSKKRYEDISTMTREQLIELVFDLEILIESLEELLEIHQEVLEKSRLEEIKTTKKMNV